MAIQWRGGGVAGVVPDDFGIVVNQPSLFLGSVPRKLFDGHPVRGRRYDLACTGQI